VARRDGKFFFLLPFSSFPRRKRKEGGETTTAGELVDDLRAERKGERGKGSPSSLRSRNLAGGEEKKGRSDELVRALIEIALQRRRGKKGEGESSARARPSSRIPRATKKGKEKRERGRGAEPPPPCLLLFFAPRKKEGKRK